VAITGATIISKIDIPDFENQTTESNFEEVDLTDMAIREKLDQLERTYITQLLDKFSGNTEQASAYAKISLRTLQRKMSQYGIKAENFRSKQLPF
jgi:DNA-binding NtrC family response regulator